MVEINLGKSILFFISVIVGVVIVGQVFTSVGDVIEAQISNTTFSSQQLLFENGTAQTLLQDNIQNTTLTENNLTWLRLNGTLNFVNYSNKRIFDSYNNNFTISMWINPTNFTHQPTQTLYNKGGVRIVILGNNTNETFARIALNITNRTGANFVTFHSNQNLTLNAWQNVIVRYNGTLAEWFINGTAVGTTMTNWSGVWLGHETIRTNESDLYLGRRFEDSNNMFNGTMDEVRLYNISLSNAQIGFINNSGRRANSTLNLAGLLLWSPLNENNGTIVFDLSPNASQGNITNAVFDTDAVQLTLTENTDYLSDEAIGNITIINIDKSRSLLNVSYVFGDNLPNNNGSTVNVILSLISILFALALIAYLIIYIKDNIGDW